MEIQVHGSVPILCDAGKPEYWEMHLIFCDVGTREYTNVYLVLCECAKMKWRRGVFVCSPGSSCTDTPLGRPTAVILPCKGDICMVVYFEEVKRKNKKKISQFTKIPTLI